MKKYVSLVLSLFMLSCMSFAVSNAYAAGDPVAMLQSTADQLIDSLKQNSVTLKSNPSVVYSLARKIVVPHADLDEMSKRVLPPSIWNSATPAQRSEFKSEFTTLLVRTYASALAEYTDQTIQFSPVRGGYEGKATVRVNSQIIRSDGPPISVNYRLLSESSGWKLYDMTVEGVSLLESFRSQFAAKLSQGNMASLIADLRQHNANNSGN